MGSVSHGRIPVHGAQPEDRSPLCRAPFVAMEFDAFGDVQACCANALHPLGNVADASLREIWDGPRAQAMRAALRAGDLSLGCSVCRFRLTYGHGDLARDYYDSFPMPEDDPVRWPFSLQFSLHNTCNLACVMCGSDRSSRIRTQRSGLAPLPQAYSDEFFEQIVPFLAHAGAVDFSGGEPFLIRAHDRIWDLLIAQEERPLHSLTTNGTIWNHRVEHVLGELDTHVTVSIDGMTPETFEGIRVGAGFHDVMANLERFRAYTLERGTILTMGWSLLRQNWHELGRAALFAEERDIDLKVHTVIEPEYGIQRLPTEELARIVDALEAESIHVAPQLDRNRWTWDREVGRLRTELELRSRPGRRVLCMEPPAPGNVAHAVAAALDVQDRILDTMDRDAALEVAAADLRTWCGPVPLAKIHMAFDGSIRSADVGALLPPGLGSAPIGEAASLDHLLRRIEDVLHAALWIGEEFDEGDRLAQVLWFGRRVRDKVGLQVRALSVAAPDGIVMLLVSDGTHWPRDGFETPVTLAGVSGASC